MKYNFIRYGEKYPLFEVNNPECEIAKGNAIIFEEKVYEIKYIENIIERSDDGWYLNAKVKEVNVYIKEKSSCTLL